MTESHVAQARARNRRQWGDSCAVTSDSAAATLAGLAILREGGNAVDAAIAVSAALCVTMPMACGLGGDAVFACWHAGEGAAVGVTSLGRAPSNSSVGAFGERGLASVPLTGILSSTSPAQISAWLSFHGQGATRNLGHLLAPAIDLANRGVIVSGQYHRWIAKNLATLSNDEGLMSRYAPGGKPMAVGSRVFEGDLATTLGRLAEIADSGRSWHKDDWLPSLGASRSAELDGFFSYDDFAEDQAIIGELISLEVAASTVAVSPLPTQGYLLLQNLDLISKLPAFRSGAAAGSADKIHQMSEVFNQTFAQRIELAGDPDFVDGTDDLLSSAKLESLLSKIDTRSKSSCDYIGHYKGGDTTVFAIVDAAGNAVAGIQSLSYGFGSGVEITGTGLILNNRLGRSATLNPDDANCVAPRKRPVNTIFPYLVIADGRLRLAGGSPGGDGAAQWNSEILSSLLIEGRELDDAFASPRFTLMPGSDLIEQDELESIRVGPDTDESVCAALEEFGYRVVRLPYIGGGARAIEACRDHLSAIDDGGREGLTAAI